MTAQTSYSTTGREPAYQTIDFAEYRDGRGCVTVIEGEWDVGFDIQRVYFLSGAPADAVRGSHAHREQRSVVIAVHGSFDVLADDGSGPRTFRLDRPDVGLVLGPMVWREVLNFSPGAVAMVLSSGHYDKSDYIHERAALTRETPK